MGSCLLPVQFSLQFLSEIGLLLLSLLSIDLDRVVLLLVIVLGIDGLDI
jgi:hypothetical protein